MSRARGLATLGTVVSYKVEGTARKLRWGICVGRRIFGGSRDKNFSRRGNMFVCAGSGDLGGFVMIGLGQEDSCQEGRFGDLW